MTLGDREKAHLIGNQKVLTLFLSNQKDWWATSPLVPLFSQSYPIKIITKPSNSVWLKGLITILLGMT